MTSSISAAIYHLMGMAVDNAFDKEGVRMRFKRVHTYGITLMMGVLLSCGAMHSRTVEEMARENAKAVRGEYALMGSVASAEEDSGEEASASPSPKEKEAKGWHRDSSKKKYYVKGNGKRALGYTEIDGDAYFFDKKTSYCLVKKWKYVKYRGTRVKMYFGSNGKRSLDVTSILPKSTRYLLEVNLSDNVVVAYARDGRKGYTIPAKVMICSGGMKGHRTITGNFPILRKAGRWHVLRYNSYGQYATRIRGPYLFHSVTYDRYGNHYSLQAKEYKKLGKSASHGCIRLQVKDAKWIYDNSSRCSAKLFYKKNKKIPFPAPKAVKIGKTKGGKYYDRTDSIRK